MGNCALKPKVLSEAGAPVPEVFNDSSLEEQKIEAVKSLRYLLLQDKPDKKTEDNEKITLEKITETKPPVIEDQTDKRTEEDEKIAPEKTTVTEDLKTSPVIETKLPVMETKPLADHDQMIKKEETVREDKVNDDVSVKETEEVGREAASHN